MVPRRSAASVWLPRESFRASTISSRSVNALNDILEGHPTLGSARAVTVAVILIFAAAGLWFGKVLLSHWGIET